MRLTGSNYIQSCFVLHRNFASCSKENLRQPLPDPANMKPSLCAVLLLLLLLLGAAVSADQICFEPESESQVILTLNVIDVYAAWDYNQGKVLFTAATNASDDEFTLVDLNNNITYISNTYGCSMVPGYPEVFAQCLPDDAIYVHTIDEHDLYYVWRPFGLDWLVGITKDEGTGYYQRYISRYTARNAVLDVGVTYQSSIGVSDPSVFDRNTTG
ncbi:hypothetical protein RRG08_043330 [Elysia crispata]|uniref:Uncharacterized protein n=1 Tax=Elysia crispata TaxID=231223 RepID=A0AAE1EDB3_9GAST|nr:hypothetical protein RRG08_043330 [Elysia crispata]